MGVCSNHTGFEHISTAKSALDFPTPMSYNNKNDIGVGKDGAMNKRGIATKQRIKEQAYALFALKGFKEVTMKDICDSTGLSRGGLYGHYESTGEIFGEIVADLMNRQQEEFQSKMEQGISAVQILDEVLQRYGQEMLDGEGSLSVAIYEYFSSVPMTEAENPLYQQYLSSYRMWEQLLRYGMERGELRQTEIKRVFDLLIFSYQGVRMCSRLMPVDSQIPEGILSQIRALLVA